MKLEFFMVGANFGGSSDQPCLVVMDDGKYLSAEQYEKLAAKLNETDANIQRLESEVKKLTNALAHVFDDVNEDVTTHR